MAKISMDAERFIESLRRFFVYEDPWIFEIYMMDLYDIDAYEISGYTTHGNNRVYKNKPGVVVYEISSKKDQLDRAIKLKKLRARDKCLRLFEKEYQN